MELLVEKVVTDFRNHSLNLCFVLHVSRLLLWKLLSKASLLYNVPFLLHLSLVIGLVFLQSLPAIHIQRLISDLTWEVPKEVLNQEEV